MGYFSNGAEGEAYYEQWCTRCIHNNEPDGPYCPVWTLHKQHNYDECNKPESFLHVLIPRTEDRCGNKQCTMFIPAPSIGLPFGEG